MTPAIIPSYVASHVASHVPYAMLCMPCYAVRSSCGAVQCGAVQCGVLQWKKEPGSTTASSKIDVDCNTPDAPDSHNLHSKPGHNIIFSLFLPCPIQPGPEGAKKEPGAQARDGTVVDLKWSWRTGYLATAVEWREKAGAPWVVLGLPGSSWVFLGLDGA